MDLLLKAALGALVVVLLAALSKTRNYYIAGLVPLFPTFALIAHYIVGKGRSIDDLKTTILFGMWSIIPYFIYLATLYVLVGPAAPGSLAGTGGSRLVAGGQRAGQPLAAFSRLIRRRRPAPPSALCWPVLCICRQSPYAVRLHGRWSEAERLCNPARHKALTLLF